MYFDYNSRATGPDRMRQFVDAAHGFGLFTGLVISAVCGAVGTFVGTSFGNWMKSVQR
jgi:hypothetical protein